MAGQSGAQKFWGSWLKRILARVCPVMWRVPPSQIRSARRGGSQSKEKGAHTNGNNNLQLRVLIL